MDKNDCISHLIYKGVRTISCVILQDWLLLFSRYVQCMLLIIIYFSVATQKKRKKKEKVRQVLSHVSGTGKDLKVGCWLSDLSDFFSSHWLCLSTLL